MVLQGFIDEWAARTAALESRIAREPDGPTWLWLIRLRILRFMMSRYADVPSATAPEDTPPAPRPPRPQAWHGEVLEVPPRSRQVLGPVLEDLEETNRRRRFQQAFEAPPDLVWEWWRARWCTPPGVSGGRVGRVSRPARSAG